MEKTDQKLEQSKERVESSGKYFLKSLKDLGSQVMNLREGMDVKGTVEGIKKDVEFNGYNVWILICSIFIASLGLNTNSTAVIIGAMLISPLMGPILGIGLAIGTNDFRLLVKSLKNFAVMIVVSLITSALYFLIFPSYEVQSEILARTRPTILDVLVAIFGGSAGIIAGSRKEKTNVIPGVAIATALMPPLCTAGFGLATFNFQYLFGAFYLFTLNSVFICLTTYLFIRYFRFPIKQFVDASREKKVKQWITIFVILVVVPSAWVFLGVLKESYFKGKAKNYIAEKIQTLDTQILKTQASYSDSTNIIEVFVLGEPIPSDKITELQAALVDYGLKGTFLVENTELVVHQNQNDTEKLTGMISELETKFLKNSYEENVHIIESQKKRIADLEKQSLNTDTLLLKQIKKELAIEYPWVSSIGLSSLILAQDSVLSKKEVISYKFENSKKITPKQIQKFQDFVRIRLSKPNAVFFKMD